jgi:hypothetical protein
MEDKPCSTCMSMCWEDGQWLGRLVDHLGMSAKTSRSARPNQHHEPSKPFQGSAQFEFVSIKIRGNASLTSPWDRRKSVVGGPEWAFLRALEWGRAQPRRHLDGRKSVVGSAVFGFFGMVEAKSGRWGGSVI